MIGQVKVVKVNVIPLSLNKLLKGENFLLVLTSLEWINTIYWGSIRHSMYRCSNLVLSPHIFELRLKIDFRYHASWWGS